jgi:small subunit ribosomal protein S4
MSLKKKNRFKPVFKQFLKLRENVQDRQKVLKFKKRKWRSFLTFYSNKLRNYKKFKPFDQSRYFVTRYGTRGVSYNKRFRDTLQAGKRLRSFYGNLLKNYFKNKIKLVCSKKKSLLKTENVFLHLFESRLDTVLYRAKFAPTMRSARQLILHGKVYVNHIQVKSTAYNLKNGDIINLSSDCFNLYEKHIINSIKWPIPPKHLLINYRTLQIIFIDNVELTNVANEFSFNLRLQKVLVNYSRQ